MDDKAILEDLVKKIKVRLPDFEIRYKDEDLLQRIIGTILFFNPAYMTRFTTTMFGKVYFVSRKWAEANPRQAWKILAHEYVHLLDDQDHPIWFSASYLFPQIKALGALVTFGAFWSPWFLLSLVFLLALAPWPAPWRAKWEMRGYVMSMAVNYWCYGDIRDDQVEHIGHNFWGPNYYYMRRGQSKILEDLKLKVLKIIKGEATSLTHPVAVLDMLEVLRSHSAVKAGVRVV